MRLELCSDSYVVLDLDDTLYPEIDFVRSGFRSVAASLAPVVGRDLFAPMWSRFESGLDTFGWVVATYDAALGGMTVDDLLRHYRTHQPVICLGPGVEAFLDRLRELEVPVGLVTDGRRITQRNKLRALGIETAFDHVVISEEIGTEKPDPRNFAVFEERAPGARFHFFGDNTSKDFVVPARLGWETFCLVDTGRHIHRQTLGSPPFPDHLMTSFEELEVSCISGCSPSGG